PRHHLDERRQVAPLGPGDDEGAATVHHPKDPAVAQGPYRFAHRRPRHAQHLRQVGFRREGFADGVGAVDDVVENALDRLIDEPSTAHCTLPRPSWPLSGECMASGAAETLRSVAEAGPDG